MFNRTRPCKTCPFRIDSGGLRFLGEDRSQEIADTLLDGQTFSCHDDLSKPKNSRQHCVGAMLILEKLGCPNQMMRIGERLKMYNRNAITGHDEVFDDFDTWVESQSSRGVRKFLEIRSNIH